MTCNERERERKDSFYPCLIEFLFGEVTGSVTSSVFCEGHNDFDGFFFFSVDGKCS